MDSFHRGISWFSLGITIFLGVLQVWVVKLPEWLFFPSLFIAIGLMVYGVWPFIKQSTPQWIKNLRFRSPFYKAKNKTPSIEKCPVSIRFNPDLQDFFTQKDNYNENGERIIERIYICKVVNEGNHLLRNLSCEISRIIDIKNRPSDRERDPLNLHVKFHFDAPSLPTRIDLPPSPDWQKLWLFRGTTKGEQGSPIEIAHTTSKFHDGGRQKDVYIQFLCDGYATKVYCTRVWIEKGLLRMTHFHESDS